MAPVGYGMLALIAGVMVVAVLVGAIGGVINGRLRGEPALGAVVVAAAYVLLLMVLEKWSAWRIAVFGLLPLMLSFLVGSLTTPLLRRGPGCVRGRPRWRRWAARSWWDSCT